MTDPETIDRELHDLLRTYAPSAPEIGPDSRLVEDLGLESMQTMEMVMDLEDRLDAAIPLNMLPDVRTVDELARVLEGVLA